MGSAPLKAQHRYRCMIVSLCAIVSLTLAVLPTARLTASSSSLVKLGTVCGCGCGVGCNCCCARFGGESESVLEGEEESSSYSIALRGEEDGSIDAAAVAGFRVLCG